MNKYAQLTLANGNTEQFSLKDICGIYLDSNNEIVIDYSFGSKFKINSAVGYSQDDLDIVFNVIKTAQEEKWKRVLYAIPNIKGLFSIPSVSFTF